MKYTLSIIVLSLAATAGCATRDEASTTSKIVQQTRSGVTGAAMTPLKDLNLAREDIPALLLEINNPYAVQKNSSCDDIKAQIAALDEVLGPDWDLPRDDADADPDKETLSDIAAEETSDSLLDAVASEAGAIVPYRSLLRRVTGARRHQKKVKNAFDRGRHRRTYLKGLGLMKQCDGIADPAETAKADDARMVFHGDEPAGYHTREAVPESAEPATDAYEPEPPARTDLAPAEITETPMSAPSYEANLKRAEKTSSPPIED